MGKIIQHPAAPEPTYSAPVPLTAAHEFANFDCGKPPLNDWLKMHALKQEGFSARCFAVARGALVVGYYTLSNGAVVHERAPGKLRRNMPDPVPVMVMGRLAVDLGHQGKKLGKFLVKDAFARVITLSRGAGCRAVIVHAIDKEIVPFYLRFGFKPFPTNELTLFLPIETFVKALG